MPEFKTKLVYICRLCGSRDDSFAITQTAKDIEHCGLRTRLRDTDSVTVLPSLARVPILYTHQCTQWMSGIADLMGVETVSMEQQGLEVQPKLNVKPQQQATKEDVAAPIQKKLERSEFSAALPAPHVTYTETRPILQKRLVDYAKAGVNIDSQMHNIVDVAYLSGLKEGRKKAVDENVDPLDRL